VLCTRCLRVRRTNCHAFVFPGHEAKRVIPSRVYALLGITLLVLTGSLASAQQTAAPFSAAQAEGKTILSIRYSPGSFLEASDLEAAQPLRIGSPLHAHEVAEAIDSLFATGQFADISAEAEPSGQGVALTFVVKPRVFIERVEFRGKIRQPPNATELRSFSQLDLASPFRETDVANAVSSMNRLFEANGLYHTTIEPQLTYSDSGDQVFVTFQIHEPKRAKYDHPEIEGETLLPESVILRVSGWRVPIIHLWRKVTQSRTSTGVRAIQQKYEGQGRLTAKVDLTGVDYDEARRRVKPKLDIVPGPKVDVKAVEAKVSKKVLKRYVPIYQEHTVDNELLVEGKRNLEDYFQSQGYYDVDIDFRVSPVANDHETIEYVIARGVRRKVADVEIQGNAYFDLKTIRERMFIQPAAFNLRHGRYSEAFRRKDEENIADLYKSNGFRDVTVSTSTVDNYKGKAGEMGVTVKIEEGQQWIVSDVTVNGVTQMNLEELRSRMATIAGQPFSEVNLAADRQMVLTRYFEQGYPAARFEAGWRESSPRKVSVLYTVTEGNRQYVRDVLISGRRITRPKMIEKAMTLKPGDPLSSVEQTQIQQSLYDLGIFARVDTAIENPEGTAAHKFVLFDFQEGNRYNVNVGIGAQVARFGTPSSTNLSSPGGTTGFSPQVSFDVSRLNFLGLGHTVSLRAEYSSIEKRASLNYLQPRFRNIAGRNISYTLLFDQSLNVRTFASRREQASVQISQKLSRSLTAQVGLAYRRVSVSSIAIPVLLIPQIVQPVRVGIITANLVQDRRNNPSEPSRGIYNTIDLGLATKALGSQRSFGRVLARNATYYQLTRSIVLARQTQFGIIAPFSAPAGLTAQQSVPLPERFFGGGADSLRAFPYNQAGPRDTGAPAVAGGPSSQPTGFPLGGSALFFNNVELRFPLIGENIRGVFFHDMGNVFSSIGNLSLRFHQRDLQDFDYTVHAVGVGIRYRTPVGPVRADLAYSVNPPAYNGFGGTAVQLLQCNPNVPLTSLPGYCQPSRQNVSHLQFFFSIGQTF